MKRFVPATLAFLLLTGFGFSNPAKMVSKLASNPLVSSLMSGLGLNANQVYKAKSRVLARVRATVAEGRPA